MANYDGIARSNYFKVKDVEAFKEAFSDLSVTVISRDGLVGLIADDDDGWPSWNQETDEDIFIPELVAPHLEDGWVAIFEEVGHEKFRYVTGIAHAINNKGELRSLNLSSISELAKELGEHVTEASY